MSESFFKFKIKCPECGTITSSADGFETDDWVEVFVFSGYSPKSATHYHDYTCSVCKKTTNIDYLFSQKLIFPESIERVKSYLFEMLPYVLERKGLYDHGWDPDIETAVQRYASLYPADQELKLLLKLYYLAYHFPRQLIKLEPLPGTSIITREMIVCPSTLEKVYLPDGLSEIQDHTFCKCVKLKDIFLPKTVYRIGKSAFESCTALTSIHTSDKLAIIDDCAFSGCVSLKSFFFPNGITEIGNQSFLNCKSLKKVFIPDSCQKIGQDAFGNCPDIIIHGKTGTVAEEYAKEHDIIYIAD